MSFRAGPVLSVPLLAMMLAWTGSARAQVLGPVQRTLPNLPLPAAPLPGALPALGRQGVDDLLRRPLALTLKTQIDALRREEPRRVDLDPNGAPILRGEFLAIGLTDARLAAVQALGFAVDREAATDATLGLDFMRLHDNRGRGTQDAMRALQQAAPGATFTYQHLYLPAGDADVAPAAGSTAPAPGAARRSVGMVDGGVDPSDPALAHAQVETHGCATKNASRHGTAVAARLVAGDTDILYAADLWCADRVGGATSQLVDALAWMDRERVAVINISLVGPDNPVLARAVQAMLARGHVLVGAAGNDGPAAPPLFPAAYPGVIGVGAVDARGRVLPESASGKQVAFCALGVVGRGRDGLRGTSFAAPIVARRAAQLLASPQAGAAARIEAALARQARDLGAPGRDARYGFGLLAPQG